MAMLEYPQEYIITKVCNYGSSRSWYGYHYDNNKGKYAESWYMPRPDYWGKKFPSVKDAQAFLSNLLIDGIYKDCKDVIVAESEDDFDWETNHAIIILRVPVKFYYGEKWMKVLTEGRKLDKEPMFKRGEKVYVVKEASRDECYDKLILAEVTDIDVIGNEYHYDLKNAPYYSLAENDCDLYSVEKIREIGKFYQERNGHWYWKSNKSGTILDADRALE